MTAGGGSARPVAPAGFPVLVPMSTRWQDNDAYGHVNNAVYYEYFDTAVNSWLRERAGAVAHSGAAIGVVAESGCRYLQEITFPDELLVGLGCDRLGRTSVTYRLAVFRAGHDPAGGSDASAVAVGRFVHVYVDRVSRRPVPIPAGVRKAVEEDLVVPGPGDDVPRPGLPEGGPS